MGEIEIIKADGIEKLEVVYEGAVSPHNGEMKTGDTSEYHVFDIG